MKKQPTETKSKSRMSPRDSVAREAKAIVAIAFRNGQIEDIHAGKPCPVCDGRSEYSHITDEEMKHIMKTAVDRIFTLLVLRKENRRAYAALLEFGALYTRSWDNPALTSDL